MQGFSHLGGKTTGHWNPFQTFTCFVFSSLSQRSVIHKCSLSFYSDVPATVLERAAVHECAEHLLHLQQWEFVSTNSSKAKAHFWTDSFLSLVPVFHGAPEVLSPGLESLIFKKKMQMIVRWTIIFIDLTLKVNMIWWWYDYEGRSYFLTLLCASL